MPHATPVAGGTDVMVGLNLDHFRPAAMLDISRLSELGGCELSDSTLSLGAATTFTQIERDDRIVNATPALSAAARTVGSPQIRNRATIGGNIATASPAGDSLPVLVAVGAQIEVASAERGARRIPASEWVVAPKRSAAKDDELVTRIHMPVCAARHLASQQCCKIVTRNAMGISVTGFARHIDFEKGYVGTGIGSAGPTIIQAVEAENFLKVQMQGIEGDLRGKQPAEIFSSAVIDQFAELVCGAAQPIDDVRGSARFRRHALVVLARRSLGWIIDDLFGKDETVIAGRVSR